MQSDKQTRTQADNQTKIKSDKHKDILTIRQKQINRHKTDIQEKRQSVKVILYFTDTTFEVKTKMVKDGSNRQYICIM